MSPESAQETGMPPQAPPKGVRLLWTLLGVLLLTSLVPLFLTAYKLMDINRESLEAASREYQLEVAAGIVQDLDAVVRGSRQQLSAGSHFLESFLGRSGRGPAPRDDRLLTPYLAGDVVLLRYTSREGTVLEVGDSRIAPAQALSGAMFDAYATVVSGEVFLGRPLHDEAHTRPSMVAAV